jgi:hypothetical protein
MIKLLRTNSTTISPSITKKKRIKRLRMIGLILLRTSPNPYISITIYNNDRLVYNHLHIYMLNKYILTAIYCLHSTLSAFYTISILHYQHYSLTALFTISILHFQHSTLSAFVISVHLLLFFAHPHQLL